MKVVGNADCDCLRSEGIPCPHDLKLAGIDLEGWFERMFLSLRDTEDMQWANDTRTEASQIGNGLMQRRNPGEALLSFLDFWQICECRRLLRKRGSLCTGEDMEKLILRWMPSIQKKLGHEAHPRYVAYLIIYLIGRLERR